MAYNISAFAGAGAQFLDDNGDPLTGGLLYVYTAGTTTPATTWTSNSGASANTNPIVLDAAGRTPAEIWVNSGATYKFILKTSTGTLVGTYDNIPAVDDPTVFNNLITVTGINSLIGTSVPAYTSYVAGMTLSFIPVATNTGAVTIDVDGLGAKNIYLGQSAAMVGGELVAGRIAQIEYDGIRFQLYQATISIPDNSITTAKLVDGAVTTAKLDDASVTIAKIDATGTPSAGTALLGNGTWGTVSYTGAATTTSATGVILTNASSQVQSISMTAAGQYVTLPDATTMTKGGIAFQIANIGAYPFGVKDSLGNIVDNVIDLYEVTDFSLSENTGVGGKWVAGASTVLPYSWGPLNTSAVTATNVQCVSLSSTQALLVYNTAANAASVVLATISGGTVTLGTPVSLYAATHSSIRATVKLSSTSVAVFAGAAAAAQGFAVNISGTTVTVGTATSAGVAWSQGYAAIANTSSTGLLVSAVSATSVSAIAFSVSGTTISYGTASTGFITMTSDSLTVGVAKSDTNTFVIGCCGTGAQLKHRALTLSGTTISVGATTTTDATNVAFGGPSGQGFGFYGGANAGIGSGRVTFANYIYAYSVQYSGTTYTASSALLTYNSAIGAANGNGFAYPVGTSNALVTLKDITTNYFSTGVILPLSTGSVSAASVTPVNAQVTAVAGNSLCALDSTTLLVSTAINTGSGTSYLNNQILKFNY